MPRASTTPPPTRRWPRSRRTVAGGQERILRRRIRTVNATKKITRAMELIAASRIVRARARVDASRPYAEELRKALSEAASSTRVDHPLLTPGVDPKRAAVL